ncbi:DUF3445 domain-containing protein [Rhodobacteraceae bacterium CCMM004]|nr:DUF3445 domain-containing protein [Rhodobacteraceae bacterium CCMM004]
MAILQDGLPGDFFTGPLPGIRPLTGPWLPVDGAFAAQMDLRDRLIRTRRSEVIAAMPGADAAAQELLREVAADVAAQPGTGRSPGGLRRADGAEIPLDGADPMAAAGRLTQSDLCLLDKAPGAAQHVLIAAVLCFPASWTLSEKIGRPLSAIHGPVASYDADVARRVQRLFDGVRVGRPLVRHNRLAYADPALHQPRSEKAPKEEPLDARYVRSERQVVRRLPETGAVVFSIHTTVIPAGVRTWTAPTAPGAEPTA